MGCYNKSTVSFFGHSGMSQTEKSQGDNVMLCKVCNEKPSKFLLVVALNPDILVLNVASIRVHTKTLRHFPRQCEKVYQIVFLSLLFDFYPLFYLLIINKQFAKVVYKLFIW